MSFEIGDQVCFPGRPETYTVERIVPPAQASALIYDTHVVMSRVTERGGVERISADIETIAHLAEE